LSHWDTMKPLWYASFQHYLLAEHHPFIQQPLDLMHLAMSCPNHVVKFSNSTTHCHMLQLGAWRPHAIFASSEQLWSSPQASVFLIVRVVLITINYFYISLLLVLKVGFKPNSTPQNRLVRCGLHLTYILWNCLISSRCGTSNTPLTLRYIHLVYGSRNGWSVSDPIVDGTKCPRNLTRIGFLILFKQWLWYHVRSGF